MARAKQVQRYLIRKGIKAAMRTVPYAGVAAGVVDAAKAVARQYSRAKGGTKRTAYAQTRTDASMRKRYVTVGKYRGKMKYGKKKKQMLTAWNVYSNNGWISEEECSGVITDPDCVYIGASVIDNYRIVVHAVEAMLRKLFRKAGCETKSIQ